MGASLDGPRIADLIQLPSFVKTAIVAQVKVATLEQQAQRPQTLDPGAYATSAALLGGYSHPSQHTLDPPITSAEMHIEREVAMALPSCPSIYDPRLQDAHAAKQVFALIARHAVILLGRSPSCPSLLHRQTSIPAQKTYDILRPLLTMAGLQETDLFTSSRERDSGFGVGHPRGSVQALSWHKHAPTSKLSREWHTANCSTHKAPTPTIEDVVHGNAATFFMDEDRDARQYTPWQLRCPKDGDKVLVRAIVLAQRQYELMSLPV
jgi:hypothetical protein